ncbi:hypothetical protein GCM10010220_00210 [Streptomyces parvulus]|nr:hypothetical protein GCM10010220_00210 [Streptomyces parvulus]
MTGACNGTPDEAAAGSEGPLCEDFVGAVMTLRSCHAGTTPRAHRHPVAPGTPTVRRAPEAVTSGAGRFQRMP